MKQHEISPEVIAELIQFLSPNIHHSLRQQALDCVIGLSSSDQFNAIFQAKDFLLGQSLCQLICEDIIDGSDVLPALINVTATDVICAKYVISNTELIKRCIEYCRSNNERYSLNAGKLLSNLSLHFPDWLYTTLMEDLEDLVADIIKRLNEPVSDESANYLGYVLVNLTSIAKVRCLLCEKFVQQMLPLVDCNKTPERYLIAIDILRNMCFESSCHPILLDKNDEFLSALLKPLADVNDNLDDDEIDKLPLQLQYYEGHRCQEPLITNKIVESLYLLCGSEVGRKTLRIKGVYSLLREFDRSSLASAALLKKNSLEESPVVLVSEDGITNNHSQSEMHERLDLKVGSAVHDIQKMVTGVTGVKNIKFFGETGNLIYIDGQNCSTLHALIGLLIQD